MDKVRIGGHFMEGAADFYCEIDWPAHSLELFIRLVHQTGFRLSKNKREAHFAWMTDDEVTRSERVVADSFEGLAALSREND